MAVNGCRFGRSVCSLPYILLLVLLLPNAASASLQPLDGGGNFHSYVDVVNRWVAEDRLDVLVLIEVANRDLNYRDEDGYKVGRMRLEVELVPLAGEPLRIKRPVRTADLTSDDANSSTLFQVFGVVFEDVPFRAGRINCTVYDVNRRRPGLLNQAGRRNSRSESSGLWFAEDSPRAAAGVALEDPLFLAHAPLATWNPDNPAEAAGTDGWLHDYMHPSRRYGLEQDRLQIFQPVWPAAGGVAVRGRSAAGD